MIFTKKDNPREHAAIAYCWNALNRKESYHTYCSQVAVERTEEWGVIMIATDGRALFISTLPDSELEPGLYKVAPVSGQKGFSLEHDNDGEPFPNWRRVLPFESLDDVKNYRPGLNLTVQKERFTFPSELRETQYALARIGILLNERYLSPLVEKDSFPGVFEWTFWARSDDHSLCVFRGKSIKDDSVERLALIMSTSTRDVPVFNGFPEA